MPRPLAPAAADAHQDRLLARADRAADAAESAVLKVWLRLLRVIKAGGPWVVVYHAAAAALRSLPEAARVVTADLAATARDAARWTAEHVAAGLPAAHRAALCRRCVRPHLFEARDPDPPEPEFLTPVEENDLVVGAILPALTDAEVLNVLHAAGWVERLKALTALAAPDALAAGIATAVRQGLSVQQIARQVRPALQNVQTVARRVARTAGLWVSHEAELATYDGLGDLIDGYEVRAVLDHATRPEHRKRDGTRYYRVPKVGQKGFGEMPRPPREADGTWAFNCRCHLVPILAGA